MTHQDAADILVLFMEYLNTHSATKLEQITIIISYGINNINIIVYNLLIWLAVECTSSFAGLFKFTTLSSDH